MIPVARRPDFLNFRSNVPKNKASLADGKSWVYYDLGPKDVEPLVMLHGTSGTAENFFYQILSLGNRGFRVVSAQWPPYWSTADWVCGFHLFLKFLDVKQVHLCGQSLGGYLALHYVAAHSNMVRSVALCNSFVDTLPFQQSNAFVKMFRLAPEFALKKFLLDSFPEKTDHPEIVDFMVEQLESLTRQDVGSRLTLNCVNSPIPDFSQQLPDDRISIIDTYDEVVLPSSMRQRLCARFKSAKMAAIKAGGDFPMLSCPADVNLHLVVHLRRNGVFPSTSSSSSSSSSSSGTPSETSETGDTASEVRMHLNAEEKTEEKKEVSEVTQPYDGSDQKKQIESGKQEPKTEVLRGVDLDEALFQDKARHEQLLRDTQRNLAESESEKKAENEKTESENEKKAGKTETGETKAELASADENRKNPATETTTKQGDAAVVGKAENDGEKKAAEEGEKKPEGGEKKAENEAGRAQGKNEGEESSENVVTITQWTQGEPAAQPASNPAVKAKEEPKETEI